MLLTTDQGRLPAVPCSWYLIRRSILRVFLVSPVLIFPLQPEPETCLSASSVSSFRTPFAFHAVRQTLLSSVGGHSQGTLVGDVFLGLTCTSPRGPRGLLWSRPICHCLSPLGEKELHVLTLHRRSLPRVAVKGTALPGPQRLHLSVTKPLMKNEKRARMAAPQTGLHM